MYIFFLRYRDRKNENFQREKKLEKFFVAKKKNEKSKYAFYLKNDGKEFFWVNLKFFLDLNSFFLI